MRWLYQSATKTSVYISNGNEQTMAPFYERLGFGFSHAVLDGFIFAYHQKIQKSKRINYRLSNLLRFVPHRKKAYWQISQPHKEKRGPCSMGFPSSSVKLISLFTTMGPAVFLKIVGVCISFIFPKYKSDTKQESTSFIFFT